MADVGVAASGRCLTGGPSSSAAPRGCSASDSPDSKPSLTLGLHYSPNGKAIFCPTNDGALGVFDPKTGRLIHSLHGPSRITPHIGGEKGGPSLYSAAGLGVFSPDGKSILCEGTDGSVMFFDFETGRYLRSIKGPHPFGHFVQTPDGRFLISLDYGVPVADAGLRVWAMNTCEEKKLLGQGYGTFSKILCDDQVVVVNRWETTGPMTGLQAFRLADGVKLWQDDEKGKLLYGWIGKNEIAVEDQKAPSKVYSAINTTNGKMRPLEPADHAPTRITTAGQVYNQTAFARRNSGTILVTEAMTNKELFRFETAYSPFGSTALSPDGKRVAPG